MRSISFLKRIICAFYPERCPYCKTVINPEDYACTDCIEKFPNKGFINPAIGGYRCVTPFLYKDIFSDSIKNLKFGNNRQYAPLLAVPIAKQIKIFYKKINFDFVTSVPLHKDRIKERGFNQSELLGINIAKYLNIPYHETLIKKKDNSIQHNLPRDMRSKNVKNVYETINKDILKNKTILLCDDIITTGYTLGECAKTLEKGNPNNVFCAALCFVLPK